MSEVFESPPDVESIRCTECGVVVGSGDEGPHCVRDVVERFRTKVASQDAEIARLRAENAAMRAALHVANDYALEQGAYSHGPNCLLESCLHRRMFEALAVLDRQHPQQGPVSTTPAVTPAGPPSASTDDGDGG